MFRIWHNGHGGRQTPSWRNLEAAFGVHSLHVSRKVIGEFFCQLFLQSSQIAKEVAVREPRMFKGLRQSCPQLESSQDKQDMINIFDNSRAM